MLLAEAMARWACSMLSTLLDRWRCMMASLIEAKANTV